MNRLSRFPLIAELQKSSRMEARQASCVDLVGLDMRMGDRPDLHGFAISMRATKRGRTGTTAIVLPVASTTTSSLLQVLAEPFQSRARHVYAAGLSQLRGMLCSGVMFGWATPSRKKVVPSARLRALFEMTKAAATGPWRGRHRGDHLATVCRAFEMSRRREALLFKHRAEVDICSLLEHDHKLCSLRAVRGLTQCMVRPCIARGFDNLAVSGLVSMYAQLKVGVALL